MNIKKILLTIFATLILIAFFFFGYLITFSEDSKEVYDFCGSSYRNESFKEHFTQTDPSKLIVCMDNDNYRRCLHYNASYEQRRFVEECQWGQGMYFQLLFTVAYWIMGFAFIVIAFFADKMRVSK